LADAAPGAPQAGYLLVDKPAGRTSHQIVAAARREHGLRAGHAGTLDPFATGLLVVLLGQGTRLQRYVLGLPKAYVATARLGWRSSTGDPEGELIETGSGPERLELPTGTITQRVPLTSAVKVGGERLYRRAHRGELDTERPEREVEIYRAELLDSDAERATFEIECSAGTYVRTLIEELGDAYCEELRRTAIGHLRLEDAGAEVRPVEELVSYLPERELGEEEARKVVHGVKLRHDPGAGDSDAGPVRLTRGGRLLAIARPRGELLKTEVVLA
jgi:tRNA pseudouridine55 synthase